MRSKSATVKRGQHEATVTISLTPQHGKSVLKEDVTLRTVIVVDVEDYHG